MCMIRPGEEYLQQVFFAAVFLKHYSFKDWASFEIHLQLPVFFQSMCWCLAFTFFLNCVHSLVSMFTDWLSCKKFFYVYFRLYILSDRPSCKIPFIRWKMIFVIDYANLKRLSQLFLLLISFTALLQKLSISSHKFSRATASQRITSCVYMQCTSFQEVNPFLEIT